MRNGVDRRAKYKDLAEQLAHWGAFFTALFTLVAVWIAYTTFKENLYMQQEVAAIGVYNEYLKQVSLNYNFIDPDYVRRIKKGSKEDKAYYHFTQYALFSSESLFTLSYTRGNKEWLRTIDYMLEPHISDNLINELDNSSYNPEFVEYLKNLSARLKYNK